MRENKPSRRLATERPLPSYAFLPGRHPHPIRDEDGHSHGTISSTQIEEPIAILRWGLDLFTNGYYWEAHEAWEGLWTTSMPGSSKKTLMKGLILLAASGVKLRTGKPDAAGRHAKRASLLLRGVVGHAADEFKHASGFTPVDFADVADRIALAPDASSAEVGAPPSLAPQLASLGGKLRYVNLANDGSP